MITITLERGKVTSLLVALVAWSIAVSLNAEAAPFDLHVGSPNILKESYRDYALGVSATHYVLVDSLGQVHLFDGGGVRFGTPSGTLPNPIAVGFSLLRSPTITPLGSDPLVVFWLEHLQSNRLVGYRLEATGVPYAGPIAISSDYKSSFQHDLTAAGTTESAIVLWKGESVASMVEHVNLYFSVVDAEGKVKVRDVLFARGTWPSVATDGKDFFAVWIARVPGGIGIETAIFGLGIDGDGKLLDANPRQLARVDWRASDVVVVRKGSEYNLLWCEDVGALSGQAIFGMRISASGEAVEAAPLTLAQAGGFIREQLAVRNFSDGLVVAWRQYTIGFGPPGTVEIRTSWVSQLGPGALSNSQPAYAGGYQSRPKLAVLGERAMLSFYDRRNEMDLPRVVGVVLSRPTMLPPKFMLPVLRGNMMELRFDGGESGAIVIETSADLLEWQGLLTNNVVDLIQVPIKDVESFFRARKNF